MYYFLTYKKAVGCPSYLGTLLHETLELALKGGDMSYRWYGSIYRYLDELPEELWMISKSKKYDFDIKSDFSGFIVSNVFLDIMSKHNVGNWEKAKLHVQLKSGKPVSDKQYFFIRQQCHYHQMPSNIVDRNRSDISFREDGSVRPKLCDITKMSSGVVDLEKSDIHIKGDGTVLQMRSLVFTDKQKSDLFMLRGKDEYLFCSEKFANACKEIKIKGVDFMPVDKLKFEGMELI